MKHEFLVPPPYLNQAFESGGSSGGGWGNGITRRSFIKRTGGATVASLVAWNLTTNCAKGEHVAGSCSHIVVGSPGKVDSPTIAHGGFEVFCAYGVTPASGRAKSVVTHAQLGSSDEYGSSLQLQGSISGPECAFTATFPSSSDSRLLDTASSGTNRFETWAILEFPTVVATQTSQTVSGNLAIIVITYEWRDTTPDDPDTNIPDYVEIGRETKASTNVSMTVQRIG